MHDNFKIIYYTKKGCFETDTLADIVWSKLHRLDGPALLYSDTTEEFWFKNGKLHRLDGPAWITKKRYIRWFKNGKPHRLNGPAVIENDGTHIWYKNGKMHNDYGPSKTYKDGYVRWFWNDKEYTLNEYLKLNKKIKDKIYFKLKYGSYLSSRY